MKSMLWVPVGIGVLAVVGVGIWTVAMEIFDGAKGVAQKPMASNATNGMEETANEKAAENTTQGTR